MCAKILMLLYFLQIASLSALFNIQKLIDCFALMSCQHELEICIGYLL